MGPSEEVLAGHERLLAAMAEVTPVLEGQTESEVRQFLKGFLHVIEQGARGDTGPRDEYLATVIPATKHAGIPLPTVMKILVSVSSALVAAFSTENRRWLIDYLSDYAARLVTTWEET
jgi:hypothetical protein